MLQRSPEVKDYIRGLEIFANNFRTSIATGNMFTPFSFFCKGAPNHVYIDFKRSSSNLAQGQSKFDLRSMSNIPKLCHVVCHSTRCDGIEAFILLCAFSGSKGNYHRRNQCSVRKNILYSEKGMTSFFDLRFFGVPCIVEENQWHLGS